MLQDLRDEETISLIEAEQGLLASYMAALDERQQQDAQAFKQQYGKSFDSELRSAVRKEFKDAVFRNEQDEGRLTKDVLRETCSMMDDRLGIADWNEDIAETHTERCDDIIEKAEREQ